MFTKQNKQQTQSVDNRLQIDKRLQLEHAKLKDLLRQTSEGIKILKETSGLNKPK